MPPQPNNILLVGFMATGKSRVGRALARRTGRPLRDADQEIVRRAGQSIEQIFAEQGEQAFREREKAVIADLCAGAGQIIAAGGGAFLDPENRRTMLAAGLVFCLTAPPETIYQRLTAGAAAGQAARPLLAGDNPLQRIRELLAQRDAAYAQAHHRIATDHRAPEQIAAEILELWKAGA